MHRRRNCCFCYLTCYLPLPEYCLVCWYLYKNEYKFFSFIFTFIQSTAQQFQLYHIASSSHRRSTLCLSCTTIRYMFYMHKLFTCFIMSFLSFFVLCLLFCFDVMLYIIVIMWDHYWDLEILQQSVEHISIITSRYISQLNPLSPFSSFLHYK